METPLLHPTDLAEVGAPLGTVSPGEAAQRLFEGMISLGQVLMEPSVDLYTLARTTASRIQNRGVATPEEIATLIGVAVALAGHAKISLLGAVSTHLYGEALDRLNSAEGPE